MDSERLSTGFLGRRLFFLAALVPLVAPFSSAPGADSQNKDGSSETTGERLKPKFVCRGADPWTIEYKGRYYRSCPEGRELCLYVSDSPEEPGERRVVWEAPSEGPISREIWAPEIHFIDGRFYIYFAADDGNNKNHLTYVLVSENDDPFSKYEVKGPLYTGDDFRHKKDNRWAIDATVLELRRKRYLIWSGWEDDRDVQYLYAAPLGNPPVRTTGARSRICDNADFLWERVEEKPETRGLNEGPEVLYSPNGRIFLTYSCGASWLPTYKVGILELVGKDPLDPKSWKKYPEPFFQSDEFQFGVGHGSFPADKDGDRRFLYHAKRSREPGWSRDVFIRNVDFDDSGFPRVRY